jgi:hypothetical protein
VLPVLTEEAAQRLKTALKRRSQRKVKSKKR